MTIDNKKTCFGKYFAEKGEFATMELGLDRISKALKESGFNEAYLGQTIHIAGTNGKGSTSTILEGWLRECGYRTAIFTSPHINSPKERIKINGWDITTDDFDAVFNEHLNIIEKNNLSYYEALTLCAFIHFARLKPDFSIIETGLGGRFDATNVLENKIPVITTIAKDHAQWLGDTLEKIALEKFAIVKNNQDVFIGKNSASVIDLANNEFAGKNLHILNSANAEIFNSKLPKPFSYNEALASMVFQHITGEKPTGLHSALPQCRMERLGQFILDGAHNPNGLIAVLKNFEKIKVAVISSTTDRDIESITKILKTKAEHIIITEITGFDRSINVSELTGFLDNKNITAEASTDKAVKLAVELAGNTDILVAGSLYLCAELRNIIKKDYLK